MTQPTTTLLRPPTRPRRAALARRPRRGSVMILVIALLVLLALIGTAFITTTQTDRYATTMHDYNTQIDLLVQGVVELSQDAIVKDVFSNGVFRPNGYNNWDGLGVAPAPAGGEARGRARRPVPRGPRAADLPGLGPGRMGAHQRLAAGDHPRDAVRVAAERVRLRQPRLRAADIGFHHAPVGAKKDYPALIVTDPAAPGTEKGQTFLAADADGDGIADAALFRLPIGQINGVTYYAAIRVVDNAAALNVNMANKPHSSADATGWGTTVLPDSYLPSHADLLSMLTSPADLTTLNNYRTNGNLKPTPPPPPPPAPPPSPLATFSFNSYAEALYTGLGTRIGNPATGFSALPIGESIALAYHGGLRNPESSGTPIDTYLPASAGAASYANRVPFLATDVSNWYNTLYNPAPPSAKWSARPLFVTRNPVSTFVPTRYVARGQYDANQTYTFGDWVTLKAPGSDSNPAYLCIQPNTKTAPGPASTSYWAVQPWSVHPTKISVNTGTFGQLWGAYWAVMARAVSTTPGGVDLSGRQFRPVGHDILSPVSAPGSMTQNQMRQLRSALAAINAQALRNANDVVPSRTIVLPADGGAGPFTVNIGGLQPQPYITEAVVHMYPEPTKPPYVAIELYNPHSRPVYLSNLTLASCDRKSRTLLPIAKLSDASVKAPAFLDPGATLVIESGLEDEPEDVQARYHRAED